MLVSFDFLLNKKAILKTLNDKIINFNNWKQPWTFYTFIVNNLSLTEKEKDLFNEIWNKAGSVELWNKPDLTQCANESKIYIKKQYDLSDEAIKNIVNALSYQWR